jgi:elongation factor Ts
MGAVAVTPALVKELRERTGVGMAKCKEALDQAGGSMDEAIAFLRKAGMMSAAKKEGRATKEGMVLAHQTDDVVAIVEVDAETDFVVKNDRFQEFCRAIAEEAARTKPSSVEAFLRQPYSKDPHITVDQFRSLLIQQIGENIQIRRVEIIEKSKTTSIGIYSHMGGKIVTIAVLDGAGEEGVARDVAMHVAAASPQYLSPEEIPQSVVQLEKDVAAEQVKGKPANIMEKILQGKLNAFYDQCCLTRQKYIKDDSVSVGDYVASQGAARGAKNLRIVRFLRWMAGKE